jgi:hypothetical protein
LTAAAIRAVKSGPSTLMKFDCACAMTTAAAVIRKKSFKNKVLGFMAAPFAREMMDRKYSILLEHFFEKLDRVGIVALADEGKRSFPKPQRGVSKCDVCQFLQG